MLPIASFLLFFPPIVDFVEIPSLTFPGCRSVIRVVAACTTGSTCFICGERLLSPYALASEGGEPKCGLCRRLEPTYTRAVAYGSYDGTLRGLIHLLKYEQMQPAAALLGRMLAEAMAGLESCWTQPEVVVVPVPLHARKLRQRGFNQSELIARSALKRGTGSGRLVLSVGTLERRRETLSQTGLTRHQRRENIRGAFAVARPESIAGREVVLVDDVFTTGTTASECARVLRREGASKVYVATVARTLKDEAAGGKLQPEFVEGLAAAG